VLRAALLVAPSSFESFYAAHLGLDRRAYVEEYRNDFVWNYAEALRPYEVDLVTYVASNRERGLERASDGFSVRFLPLPRGWTWLEPGIRLARTPMERYALEALQARLLLPEIRRALSVDRADVLYIQEYWTGRFDVLAHRSPVPVVAGEHGGSGGMHVHLFKRASLARAAAITVQSSAERRRLERYGCRAELVTNGVDTDYFVPPAQTNRLQNVLAVGRLVDAQKRISDLIAAVAMLPTPWSLDIVGRGPDEEMLRDQAVRLGCEHRVNFCGWVASRDQLRERYGRCGVFALPSRWEAMTLALLEAMACGAVPVVTPLRPFADVIRHGKNGLVVPPESPASLARAILRAYDVRVRLGAEARATVVVDYARRTTMAKLARILHDAARSPVEARLSP
jgi:glycosyltransferase involved in cell wall biosynthesis